MREVARLVRMRLVGRRDWSDANYEADKVAIMVEEVKSEAGSILRGNPHSCQYLFILLRRVARVLWAEFQSQNPYARNDDAWFAEMIRATTSLLLEGSRPGDIWEWVDGPSVAGIDYRSVSEGDFVDLAKLVSLGQLWYESKVRYRLAGKRFKVFTDDGFPVPDSPQDRLSLDCYEERRDHFETLCGSAGLWCDPALAKPLRPNFSGWIATLNFRVSKPRSLLSKVPRREVPIDYLPICLMEKRIANGAHEQSPADGTKRHGFTLVPYDFVIKELRPSFEVALPFSAEEVTAFLYATYAMISSTLYLPYLSFPSGDDVYRMQWQHEEEAARHQAMNHWMDVGTLGLLRSSEEQWVAAIGRHAAMLTEHDASVTPLPLERIEALVRHFTWTCGTPYQDTKPILFQKLSTRTVALDFLNAVNFLRLLLLQPNLTGRDAAKRDSTGDHTGEWLERHAHHFFRRTFDLDNDSIWHGLQVPGGGGMEIDLAFILNRTLFVLDCKAMAKDPAYVQGQYAKIRNRSSVIQEQLRDKIPRRIDQLNQGRVSRVKVSRYDKAVGLVCTAAVEYLPLSEPSFWQGRHPMAGTPEELVATVRDLAGFD